MSQLVEPGKGSLQRIKQGNLCTGCGLCAALSDGAVEMTLSEDGYMRPSQRATLSKPVDSLIYDVCPGVKLTRAPVEGKDHVLWGPYISVQTGASTSEKLRHHGSSGAALSGLLTYLLENGLVTNVLQTAANDRAPLENVTVISQGAQDVYHAAGSRYAPSAPLADLDMVLESEGKFALVGKPCDIAAVRSFARHEPRINEKIPFMISFYCAGIPSLEGAHKILAELGTKEEDVAKFRYRGDGWPGRATAVLKDGQEKSMSYADSWGRILTNHVQFRCKICPDGSGGLADVVCADAWHSDEKGYPKFEEEEGRSLIVTRTRRGEELLQAAISAGYIKTQSLDVDEIEKMQPSQANRKRLILSRLFGMYMFGRLTPEYRGFNLKKAALRAGLLRNIKSSLGMMRRLLRNLN